MNLNLTCPVCGKSFQRPSYRMKEGQKSYCSPACQNKGRQITVKVFCATCGKEFAINPSRVRDTFNFCSPECFYESRKISYGEAPLCACGCGLPVTRDFGGTWHKFIHGHNFTGIKHSDETREKMRQKAQARSAEQSQRIMGEKNMMWLGGGRKITHDIERKQSMFNSYQRRKVKSRLIIERGNACERCNRTNAKLELHHIDHNLFHNTDDNLMLVCSSCNNLFTVELSNYYKALQARNPKPQAASDGAVIK